MRNIVLALAVGSVAWLAAPAAFAQAPEPMGLWLTEGAKSQVAIERCGDKLCGRIVWLKEPNDEAGKTKTDKENPEPAQRSRPILGLELLAGFVRAADATKR